MICTTVKQSEKLLELGLKPKTADMCLTWVNNQWNEVVGNADEIRHIQICNAEDNGYDPQDVKVVPAWSLPALLELMPEHIAINGEMSYCLRMKKTPGGYGFIYDGRIPTDSQVAIGMYPLEAAYNMVVWLLENGRI